MDEFTLARQKVAQYYDRTLSSIDGIKIPAKSSFSTHVYHQYTIRLENERRDGLQTYLKECGIPSNVYYPFAVHEQEGYKWVARISGNINVATRLCKEVLSLPIHTEMTDNAMQLITDSIVKFFVQNRGKPICSP